MKCPSQDAGHSPLQVDVLDFRCLAPFRHKSASKSSKIEAKFRTRWRCKI